MAILKPVWSANNILATRLRMYWDSTFSDPKGFFRFANGGDGSVIYELCSQAHPGWSTRTWNAELALLSALAFQTFNQSKCTVHPGNAPLWSINYVWKACDLKCSQKTYTGVEIILKNRLKITWNNQKQL